REQRAARLACGPADAKHAPRRPCGERAAGGGRGTGRRRRRAVRDLGGARRRPCARPWRLRAHVWRAHAAASPGARLAPARAVASLERTLPPTCLLAGRRRRSAASPLRVSSGVLVLPLPPPGWLQTGLHSARHPPEE